MPIYRMHLENGISMETFEGIVRRLGSIYRGLKPVRGGGRNLVTAIDIQTRDLNTVQWVAEDRLWERGAHDRARVKRVEAL